MCDVLCLDKRSGAMEQHWEWVGRYWCIDESAGLLWWCEGPDRGTNLKDQRFARGMLETRYEWEEGNKGNPEHVEREAWEARGSSRRRGTKCWIDWIGECTAEEATSGYRIQGEREIVWKQFEAVRWSEGRVGEEFAVTHQGDWREWETESNGWRVE